MDKGILPVRETAHTKADNMKWAYVLSEFKVITVEWCRIFHVKAERLKSKKATKESYNHGLFFFITLRMLAFSMFVKHRLP